MSRPALPAYKTRNWPAYNEALKRRGSLAIWFDPAMTWEAAPTGKRGRQPDYSDAAIQTCLTMKVLFGGHAGNVLIGRGVCQRSCPVPYQAASLILRSLVSRSGLRQTSPTGDQLRIWRDHRLGLAARASV
jgi:hypothetical protein